MAILVGAMPRRAGMERKDLLKANIRIFKQQGEALDQHAKKTVKVYFTLRSFIDTFSVFFIHMSYSPPRYVWQCLTYHWLDDAIRSAH